MQNYQKDFIAYALSCGVLKFGEFVLKSGRTSPYFFNTGLFNTGAKLARLGEFYAQTLIESSLHPDIIYGPAYKGIPLVSATSIAYAHMSGTDMPFAFNRKEAKDHGEGGAIVGAELRGSVVIVDDVITAGTSVRESVDIITKMGARASGVLVALDRQEKGESGSSAVQEVEAAYKIPVFPIITLADIIVYLETSSLIRMDVILEYRSKYGI
jgi:orotate phosphoribosyltransferase